MQFEVTEPLPHVSKYATDVELSGLADTLQSEFLLYGIDVHTFFPPTIFTPGYEKENLTKPTVTKRIEETDGGLTAEKAALGLFNGRSWLISLLVNNDTIMAYRYRERTDTHYRRFDYESLSSINSWCCSEEQLDR